jgi:hypothetical protein
MKTSQSFALGLIVLVLCGIVIAQEHIENATAHAARVKYEQAIKQARTQPEQTIAAARQEYLAQLKSAMDEETKKGKLDSAIAIRETIKQIEKEGIDSASGRKLPPGRQIIRYAGGYIRNFEVKGNSITLDHTLNPDGSKDAQKIIGIELKTQLDGSIRITYPAGDAYEIWTITPRKIFVERWFRGNFECLGASE